MRANSHRTVITVIRDYLDQWRKAQGLTLQAAAQVMVDHYFAQRLNVVWPVDFHTTGDAYMCVKANSERIWRWMDDQTKDTTLLPANLLPLVLGVLPLSSRVMCVNEVLASVGLSVAVRPGVLPAESLPQVLALMAKESGEAVAGVAGLMDGHCAAELAAVRAELVEAVAANKAALAYVEAQLAVVNRAPA